MIASIYECHCHIALDGVDFRNAAARHKNGPDVAFVRGLLEDYMNSGICYLRDGGDKWGASRLAKELAGEYGLEYASPIFPIYKKGNYGAFLGVPYESLSDYRGLVERVRREGGSFIKLMASGIMDFDCYGSITGFIPEELPELVHIAHEEGLPVMVHMNSAEGIKRAAEAGADSIEHGNYTDREALTLMAERGTIWVPTISATENLLGEGLFHEQALQAILAMQRDNIRLGHELGVTIACGSDAGAGCVPHVQSSLDEASRLGKLLGSLEPILQGQEALRARFPG